MILIHGNLSLKPMRKYLTVKRQQFIWLEA